MEYFLSHIKRNYYSNLMGTNNSFNAENLECKYCLDIIDIESNQIIRPCLCKDYIHKECFENWILKRPTNRNECINNTLNKCEICNSKYNISINKLIDKRLNKSMSRKDVYKKMCLAILLITAILVLINLVIILTTMIYKYDFEYKNQTYNINNN